MSVLVPFDFIQSLLVTMRWRLRLVFQLAHNTQWTVGCISGLSTLLRWLRSTEDFCCRSKLNHPPGTWLYLVRLLVFTKPLCRTRFHYHIARRNTASSHSTVAIFRFVASGGSALPYRLEQVAVHNKPYRHTLFMSAHAVVHFLSVKI